MNNNVVGPLITVFGLCILIVVLFWGGINDSHDTIACKMEAQQVEQHVNRTEYLRGRVNMLEQLDSLGVVPAETKRIFQDQLSAEKEAHDQVMTQQDKMSLVRDLDCEG